MAYKYARVGPPFNFLGHFTESQRQEFEKWVNKRTDNFDKIKVHYQIRAQQLRKTAGLLEQFYQSKNDEQLAPTFEKEAWQPGSDGHFVYSYRDDHVPAVMMSRLKRPFKEQLQRHDEAVFHMNLLRNQIERLEDLAQQQEDAKTKVPDLLTQVQNLFNRPEYQAVLVKDQSDLYKGEPRYRVHQLDEPTAWEKEQRKHGGDQLKEEAQTGA